MDTPILHLNLHLKWFFDIYMGYKLVEYREIKPSWQKVFIDGKIKIKGILYDPKDILICFSNGYKADRLQMWYKPIKVDIGAGYEPWGSLPDENYFCIFLQARIDANFFIITGAYAFYYWHMALNNKIEENQRFNGYFEEMGLFIAFDNMSGELFTEEFKTEIEAFKYATANTLNQKASDQPCDLMVQQF